jgi:hypothetical protein
MIRQDQISQDQIGLLKRLLHYVDTRTTSMADAPWRNDVSVYTDPRRLAEEQRILFRQYPIVMGFASEWATPGRFLAGLTEVRVGNRSARPPPVSGSPTPARPIPLAQWKWCDRSCGPTSPADLYCSVRT